MPEISRKYITKLENSFLGFWVKQYKVSFLLIFLLVLMWASSLYSIQKDASPEIELWYIQITTPYIWVNPTDIDSLITEKIEREIKDIDWIKKMTSSSVLWNSSITLELEVDAVSSEVLDDVKDELDKISLPSEAEDTIVTTLDSEDNTIFQVALYWPEENYSHDYLLSLATKLKNNLESWGDVNKVVISWDEDFEIKVLVNKEKSELLWLTPSFIASKIREYNSNTPIWNYSIKNLNYDFRFDWEMKDIEGFKKIPLSTSNGSVIYLWDISEIIKDFKNDDVVKFWTKDFSWDNALILSLEKKPNWSIFSSSTKAKEILEEELKKPEYNWVQYQIINDSSVILTDDYVSLATNLLTTILCVFLTILICIWFKEWLISLLIIPLSYCITFIVLQQMDFALNFLTNFSLILSLWVAIDTTIVVIEWANKKVAMGYTPKHAALISTREYSSSIISWTMTTLAAFLPLIFLPGVIWKYLAYIPVTIFVTLLASLFLSLTITSPIFMKLIKNKKTYSVNPAEEEIMNVENKSVLALDRAWKTENKTWIHSIRDVVFWKISNSYEKILSKVVKTTFRRLAIIFTPILVLIWTFGFGLWFTLYPAWDTPQLEVTIEAKEWSRKEVLIPYISDITTIISSIPEVKNFYINISWNILKAKVELYTEDYRETNWMRDSFKVETELSNKVNVFKQDWLKVESSSADTGPPTWAAVWIKLISDSNKNLDSLISVSKDFESYLRTIDWTKNVKTSSSSTPWQFVFQFDNNKLWALWISPNEIQNEVFSRVNWSNAGSFKWQYDDYDIVVKIKDYDEFVSPSDIQNFTVNTSVWDVKVWEVANNSFSNTISNIDRENTKILINVSSDLEDWFVWTDIQPKLLKFAEEYKYPEGISFIAWWENEENQDLIVSTMQSFVISLMLIFGILVLQFNSYSKPAIILYTVVLALIWVNIWLKLTWNPYSMSFWIWFIALTWIVINNAIIFIDKISSNLEDWLRTKESLLEAWKSRLVPMIVTTMTTILWITPLWFEDPFWAWLAFTMVFWLIAGTVLTLFVTPALYYQLFTSKEEKREDLLKDRKIIMNKEV